MDDLRDRLDWFKCVVLPHEGALRARLRSLRADPQDLDDTVAEVLARAYANHRWHEVKQGRPYLFTIARNLLIDQVRRKKIVSFETVTDLDQLQGQGNLEAQLCARDQLRRIERIIATMPAQAARAFYLRRVEQKTPTEIAVEMKLSVYTVEKHLSKAFRHFMRAIAEQEAADCVEPRQCQSEGNDRAAGG
ncbi:RNA polymerase sigma factor [Novosphingobium album (ex Hu et al. 2023)]|uniref:Sigma-70 family RNA polymerase sigma factor n=1 Tax=Novosphingobium album (ex Hu et al. 2023) TaxID=2930093 RepID=A0ABT0B079_9SPHN|nr:sigma-70 family RNA polymerase sigma factor [Novosphingobium album (ex Hu et al. 2023)]MCJ2178461.1 sigma-70 family RNA polymerase sigma factor [Novosphingobium album (ex Hu et al. 2023)]